MKISAIVTLKKEVLDPQGKVVNQTLKNMGYQDITNVRQGKYFEIEINESDKDKAKIVAEEICKKLLTNTVIEDYKRFEPIYSIMINESSEIPNKVNVKGEFNKVDIISLLKKKKQIILYGPPGTGKTYFTKKIAIDIM